MVIMFIITVALAMVDSSECKSQHIGNLTAINGMNNSKEVDGVKNICVKWFSSGLFRYKKM